MENKLDIRLRLIQQDSNEGKENYFALQKSVAILQNWEQDNEKELNEWSWQDIFKNKNRICYVIEKMPGNVYCGECAVKNISDEISEIEIELMKECQGQGIGYLAIIDMLNKLAAKYGKENYYAKIEPDNYVSRFLFEKLGGRPIGVSRDYVIPDERVEQFTERSKFLLDQDLEKVAEEFGVEAEILLTHLLVYKININAINVSYIVGGKITNRRAKTDYPRRLTREKYKETLREYLDGLHQLKEAAANEELSTMVLNDMKKKWMERKDKLNENIVFK